MADAEIEVKVTYEQIGETHVLFHFFGSNRIDNWALFDLEEYGRRSGLTIEQMLANLRKSTSRK